jgi:hypothetical protein
VLGLIAVVVVWQLLQRLVARSAASAPNPDVVPAKAGTHNHGLWNMGPRFRGDDNH